MAFLHGVETIEIQDGLTPITIVKSNVIGIVGTAPKGTPNTLTVVSGERKGVELFGSQLPGFTIPQALKSAFDQGANRIIVVNVFDPSTMVTPVVAESKTITGGKATLTAAPTDVPVVTNAGATVTFVAGTDYSIDPYGVLTVLNFTAIPEASTVLVTFDKLDASAITDSVIIGTFAGGVRTGFKMFEEANNLFGYLPKILICPTYCENDAVAAEMIVQADALRAMCIIDAPETTTVANAIIGRGPSGTLAGFQTSNKRTITAFPYIKAFSPATGLSENRPYSPFLAGIMSANPNYWESPSNTAIKGITGTEYNITAGLNDSNSEANQLNEVGITTIFSAFGTGVLAWGNRNAGFPSSSTMDTFISVRRVADITHESLEQAMLKYIDRPINQALIDTIKESCNSFIRSLIAKGALLPGSVCVYNPTDNPAVDIALGKLTFEIQMAGPTPAERITFKSLLDVSLLAQFA